MTTLSVVIPTLNAAAQIGGAIEQFGDGLGDVPVEIVVSDGGSTDPTAALARAAGARVVGGPRGRGVQIAAGVAASRGAFLLLLHADTRLGDGWQEEARQVMAGDMSRAGYFRFTLASSDPRARRLERLVAWRCRVFGLPYGDQGLLISRRFLDAVGGVQPMPLMEDVDLVRRIGRTRLLPLAAEAVTSAAKWERDGWTARSLRNLGCLALYMLGVPPAAIARLYS